MKKILSICSILTIFTFSCGFVKTDTIINIDKNISDYDIVVPLTSEYCQNLVVMVACQLLAYNVAKLNKCDIDKPRNLAKSVTVE